MLAHPNVLPLQIFLFCTYIVLYILYMMSSLGGDKARGPREKTLPTVTHSSQPQKQIQVTLTLHVGLDIKCLKTNIYSSILFCPRNSYDTADTPIFKFRGKGELTSLHFQSFQLMKKIPTHAFKTIPYACTLYVSFLFLSYDPGNCRANPPCPGDL